MKFKNKQSGEIVEGFGFSMNHNPQWFTDMQREGKVSVDYISHSITLAVENESQLFTVPLNFGNKILLNAKGFIKIYPYNDFDKYWEQIPEKTNIISNDNIQPDYIINTLPTITISVGKIAYKITDKRLTSIEFKSETECLGQIKIK